MYPDYKEQAIKVLVGMFENIVTHQFEQPMFDEHGIVSFDNKTVDLHFSTREVINIAKLIHGLPIPADRKNAIWIKGLRASVDKLAGMAEQHEYDDPDHLMHTMMNLYYVCQNNGGDGMLNAVMEEDQGMTVSFTEEFSGVHLLSAVQKAYALYEGKYEHFKIMDATLRYVDDEMGYQLTFKAIRLKNGEEVTLKNEQVSPNDKKAMADWMIDQARQDPHDSTPLQRVGDNMWTAPRMGVQEVEGVPVLTAINEITDCNILTVEVGTTGKKGGDSGHGCRTYLCINNDSSTELNCRTGLGGHDVDADGRCHYRMDATDHGHVDRVEIMLGGDSELDTFIEALDFAVDVLKKQRNGQLTSKVPAGQNKRRLKRFERF